MILRVDKTIYSDSCISKSVYALADRYSILRSSDGGDEILDIKPLCSGSCDEDFIKATIINTLNDYKLRCIIEEETKDIRTIIYAKAFSDYTDLTQ